MAGQSPTLFFLHTPKTGGSTLESVIGREYGNVPHFRVDYRRYHESLSQFRALPQSARRNLQFVLGHFLFSENLHANWPRPFTYITILRHPVERVVSHYYYLLKRPKGRLHQQVVSGGMSLRQFVESGIERYNCNGQVRFLSGLGEEVPDHAIGPAALEQARRNIEQCFSGVALLERLDESLLVLRHRLGWGPPYYATANRNSQRPPLDAVDAETLRLIRDRNRLDEELYRWAQERLQTDLEALGLEGREELRRFQHYNGNRLVMRLDSWRRRLTGRRQHVESYLGQRASS